MDSDRSSHPAEPAGNVDSASSLLPEKSGSMGSQGSSQVSPLTTEVSDAGQGGPVKAGIGDPGLQALYGVFEGTTLAIARGAAYIATAVWASRATEENRLLQGELSASKEKLARAEVRLETGGLINGLRIFINSLGGVSLGFGMSEVRQNSLGLGLACIVIGIAMLAVSAWPYVKSSWSSGNKNDG